MKKMARMTTHREGGPSPMDDAHPISDARPSARAPGQAKGQGHGGSEEIGLVADDAAVSRPSVLPSSVVLRGDIRGTGDLVVLGAIEGDVVISGTLVVEEGGRVRGDVHAQAISVRGAVMGDLAASGRLSVDPSGVVVGDLFAPSVDVAVGARVVGELNVDGASSSESRSHQATAEAQPQVTETSQPLLLIGNRADQEKRQKRSLSKGGSAKRNTPPTPRFRQLVWQQARVRETFNSTESLSGFEW